MQQELGESRTRIETLLKEAEELKLTNTHSEDQISALQKQLKDAEEQGILKLNIIFLSNIYIFFLSSSTCSSYLWK